MGTIFKRYLVAALCAAALVLVTASLSPASSKAQVRVNALRTTIAASRQSTWAWQGVAMAAKTQTSYSERKSHSVRYLVWDARLWHQRLMAAKWHAQHPPRLASWLCIHRYEGSWSDPNPPYYGGLQMDRDFMSTYGGALLRRKGTADHWLPLEQIWVAERAYKSGRGFNPWPNTARSCGLL